MLICVDACCRVLVYAVVFHHVFCDDGCCYALCVVVCWYMLLYDVVFLLRVVVLCCVVLWRGV